MITLRELLSRIAHELVAIQIGDDRRMQFAVDDQLTQVGKAFGQHEQQLPERVRLDIEISHARKVMIALAVTPTFQ